jgi:hypothetical protein
VGTDQNNILSNDEAERLDQLRKLPDKARVNYEVISSHETLVSAEDGYLIDGQCGSKIGPG